MTTAPKLGLTLGGVCEAITAAIERDFLALPATLRANGLEILISGWTWPHDINHGNARPSTFSRQIRHDGVADRRCEQVSGRSRVYSSTASGWSLLSIGADSVDLHHITDRLRGRPRADQWEVEAVITDEIRVVAKVPNSGIGRDLMSIYLPIARAAPKIRFLRDVELNRSPSAYSPALVFTSGLVAYPSVLTGDRPPDLGASFPLIEIQCVPPFAGASGNSMSSQRRRPLKM
jgi:hypothetical protein